MAYRETVQTKTRKRTQRAHILSAARRRIAQGGYQAAQIRALAEDCGIATGTVYRYFPSKADLFAEVFRLTVQAEVDAVDAAAHGRGPAEQRLEAVVTTFVHRALRAPRLAYALLAEPVDPAVESERLVFRQSYARIIETLLEQGVGTGEFAPQNVKLSAAALVGLLNETLVGPLSPSPQIDTPGQYSNIAETELIASIVALCMRAVTGRRNTP